MREPMTFWLLYTTMCASLCMLEKKINQNRDKVFVFATLTCCFLLPSSFVARSRPSIHVEQVRRINVPYTHTDRCSFSCKDTLSFLTNHRPLCLVQQNSVKDFQSLNHTLLSHQDKGRDCVTVAESTTSGYIADTICPVLMYCNSYYYYYY